MIIYYKIGILLLLLFNLDFVGVYYHHTQVCSGVYAVDREWVLDIRPGGKFTYIIRTINSKTHTNSVDSLNGVWRSTNDTLKLLTDNEKKEINFVLGGNNLIPLDKKYDTISGFVIGFQFLKKKS